MTYYLFKINNHLLPKMSKNRVRFDVEDGVDPLELWPWLDPAWGIVQEYWESFESRFVDMRNAELLVKAGDDLMTWLSPYGDIMFYNRADGNIFIDSQGYLHHVTANEKTAIEGDWAHDCFAFGFGQADDLDAFLTDQATDYIGERVEPVLRHLGLDPHPAETVESMLASLRDLDLPTANYEDLDACVDTTLALLTADPIEEEVS